MPPSGPEEDPLGLSAEHRAGIDAIQTASRDLVRMDLLELHGGNISVRADDGHMLITKHHVNKSVPSPDDIVRTSIEEDDEFTNMASSAWLVHREIYRRSDAQAIIHAHGQLTVTLSFFYDEVEPIDENGIMILGRNVPVVAAPKLIGWNLAAEPIGDALARQQGRDREVARHVRQGRRPGRRPPQDPQHGVLGRADHPGRATAGRDAQRAEVPSHRGRRVARRRLPPRHSPQYPLDHPAGGRPATRVGTGRARRRGGPGSTGS